MNVPAAAPRLLAVSWNFRAAPESLLERIALSRERLAELYAESAFAAFPESVVLSTCCRVEFYVAGAGVSAECVFKTASKISGVPENELAGAAEIFADTEAVRHLFEVASGLDSRMVGEAEILGQTKQTYETALAAGTSGVVLNRVFQKSFHCAKWARSETGISQGQISIGNVAVELASRVFGDFSRSAVLVVGTGEAGRKTAQAFISRGANNVFVAGRKFERAREVAAEIGAVALENKAILPRMLSADIVVGGASVSEPLVSAEALRALLRERRGRPLFLIDLGMPRNFPEIGADDALWVYGLEELAEIANANLAAREREAAACRRELFRRAAAVFAKL